MSAKLDRRRFIAAGTTTLAMPFVSRGASAQAAWPSRQIRMICSYPAGGQTDLLARAYGEFIAKQVGKTVVVENKPGAAGAIGTAEVARAEPDGHTILCSISTTYIMNRVVMKTPGYDMDKDLTLVSVIPGAGLLLVANPKTGVKTLEDFVAFARKSGKVNFGTYSAGSAPHMTVHELNKQYGLAIEPIHYRGEAPMWTGMLEGTLDVAMGSYTAAQSVLQSDRGTVFAVHSKKVDAIPDIKNPPRAGRDVEILHRQRLLRLGRAESDTAAGRRPPGGALRRCQQRSEGEGGSQHVRARTRDRLQGNQRPVSARAADLDRERAIARPRTRLNREA
ncbi:tripartite-type tricarboxylate transporter receptor subunit TctC [Bradyrhizobium sp. GM2.4]